MNAVFDNFGTVGGGYESFRGWPRNYNGCRRTTWQRRSVDRASGHAGRWWPVDSTTGQAVDFSSVPGGSYDWPLTMARWLMPVAVLPMHLAPAQASSYVLRHKIPSNAATRSSFWMDRVERITLAVNRALAFDVLIVARATPGRHPPGTWKVSSRTAAARRPDRDADQDDPG